MIKELQKVLVKKKIDFALFANSDFERFNYDMAYFSGYGGVGVLVVPKKKKPFIIVPKIEAKNVNEPGLKVYKPHKKKRLSEITDEKIRQNRIRKGRVGINKQEFTLELKDIFKKALGKSRFVDLKNELYKLREQKTKKEIEIIRKGCRISDDILKKCFRRFKSFKTEGEVKAYLEYETKKRGCDLAFPTIVASGKNSSVAHHKTENANLKNGFCFIDFGIRYKNYCTDTTRTVYLGKPSKKELEIYSLILDVQKKAISGLKLGKKCSEVVKEVRNGLGKYARYFTHGLGHGFGIKIHELPNLMEESKDKIKENVVFTVEPGIYMKDFGMRIEDDILVTKGKVEVLTKVSKELMIKKR